MYLSNEIIRMYFTNRFQGYFSKMQYILKLNLLAFLHINVDEFLKNIVKSNNLLYLINVT